MHVKSIKITGFRCFEELNSEFTNGCNIFYGKNGSGKTNLLEAIHVICLGRSQRASADSVILRDNSPYYRLEASIEVNNRNYEVAVAYEQGGRKKIAVEGVAVRAAELYSRFAAVTAGPEDSTILAGSPSARRLFLDIYLSQLSSKYLSDLADYQKALAQKNAALRNRMDSSAYDTLLVTIGSRIILARHEFLIDLNDKAASRYQTIAGNEPLTVNYKPSVSIEDSHVSIDEIEAAFELKQQDRFERERMLQTTLVGPHRDEVEFYIGKLPARAYGSQGQLRTAAISLKLAVYDLLKSKREINPLLLLDEVFAELDPSRSDSAVRLFEDFGQVFLTSAVDPPPGLAKSAKRFLIDSGSIKEVS